MSESTTTNPLFVTTVRELARRVGVSDATMHRIKRSRTFPKRVKVAGMSRPVYLWTEVAKWFSKQPREFE